MMEAMADWLPADWQRIETPEGPIVVSPGREPMLLIEALHLRDLLVTSSADRSRGRYRG